MVWFILSRAGQLVHEVEIEENEWSDYEKEWAEHEQEIIRAIE